MRRLTCAEECHYVIEIGLIIAELGRVDGEGVAQLAIGRAALESRFERIGRFGFQCDLVQWGWSR